MFLVYIYLFIVGTVFGSFYMVVAMRLSNNQSIIKPRSHCDICNHILKWYELIPIISYINSNGRCKNCNTKLSIMYPLIEILTGLLFCFSYFMYKESTNTLIMLILSSLLIIIYVSDFSYFIILDSPLVISSILIIIIRLFNTDFKTTILYILSGITMFMVMLFIKKLGDFLFKRESLGGGDIKLAFVIGLTLGFRISIFSLIIASFLALPYALYLIYTNRADKEMPYGPFLVTSLYILYAFYPYFINLFNLFI